MRRPGSIVAALAVLACIAPTQPRASDFYDFAGSSTELRIKWPTRTIRVSISSSLTSPAAGIKSESDVMGAVRRALGRWSAAADIEFEEVASKAQSISPVSGGDGISLITIADTAENLAIFGVGSNPARTRVFYDPETGEISEADIVISPQPLSPEGVPVQFATDGSAGTYDLESTLTHELGHLLGLEHSNIIGATMQSRQSVNGTYKLPAVTERTLSEDDRARVAWLYGLTRGAGAVEGRLTQTFLAGGSVPVAGAHVWAEDAGTGRVIASTLTSSTGSYRIEGLAAGQYRLITEYLDGPRPFRSVEIGNQVRANPNATSTLNFVIVPPQNNPPSLKPRLIGANGELSTTPLIADASERLTIFVSGEGVDQVPINGISVTSPFMTVDSNSLALHQFGTALPVVSFDVLVAPHAVFGDYSIRLQSNSGEVSYVPGAITIDPGVNFGALNPLDDPEFFVAQHYRDFLGRGPDPERAKSLIEELSGCGSDQTCESSRRVDVSAAILRSEFLENWFFIHRLYKVALGRRPTFSEFNRDRRHIADVQANLGGDRRRNFARTFVMRSEFVNRYPRDLKADKFVDSLLVSVLQISEVDLGSDRRSLAGLHNGSATGRADIIQRLAESKTLAEREDSQAFALLAYFGYLRREPDEAGYQFWLSTLGGQKISDPSAYRPMICAFITSAEYQSRFGMFVTRTDKECQVSL